MFMKLLIFAVAAFVIYKLFMGDKTKKDTERKKETEKKIAKGEMVKDPVCGAFVPIDSSIRVRDGERVHHFCSYECRDSYIQRIEANRGESKNLQE